MANWAGMRKESRLFPLKDCCYGAVQRQDYGKANPTETLGPVNNTAHSGSNADLVAIAFDV